jgi:hypothetical protein
MKTKKNVLLIITGIIVILSFQSCKKYPDETVLSLTSRTHRVSNSWKVENYRVNGTDLTSFVADYKEIFSKKGAYSYSWSILNGTGTWAFQNSDEEIKISGNDGKTLRTLVILKLEEKAFWYYYIDGDAKNEFHMIPN